MSTESRIGPKTDDEGKEIRAACSECSRETTHSIVRSARYTTQYDEKDFSITLWDNYAIIECKGCQSISFRHQSSNSENVDYDSDTGDVVPEKKVVVNPPRLAGRRELRDSWLLPTPVELAYEETLQALRGGMPVLAGIGIRALVETMCKDRGARGRNLEKKLDNLVDQGVITKDGAEILHSLRIMGNDAAHEVKPHTIEDLSIAMDVIENALQSIYILPQRAAKLPKRKSGVENKRSGKSSGA